jgi:hypothetical protein
MTETVAKDENVWQDRAVKLIIVFLVFPIIVLVFHQLLIVPSFFVESLLVHFGGDSRFWAKTLSVVSLLPACWGAVAVCKLIWPTSK